jgi:hypothetical protein
MDINQDTLRLLFNYDPVTGELTNRVPRGPAAKIGEPSGGITLCGPKNSKKTYLRVCVDGRRLYSHRVIWMMMTGEFPECIDHIDGDSLNNKWSNLRNVSHRVNGKNQKIHSTNTSGHSGVTYRKDSGRWRSRIMVDDKMINLGTFKHKEDAIAARKEAEETHGFH